MIQLLYEYTGIVIKMWVYKKFNIKGSVLYSDVIIYL